MGLGDKAAKAYLFVLCAAFPLAAPWFAPGGGYGGIADFKAAAWAVLTGAFLLAGVPDPPKLRKLTRSPARLLALGYFLLCLLSSLFSPWRKTALLGGSRSEGFLHLGLYVLSFLTLSLHSFPKRGLLCALAAGVLLLDLICLAQLVGLDPLGLYPPGLGWADRELRYPGAYLGTTGNTGQTGAVLAAASALFYLSILRAGGRRFLLLPVPVLSAFLLSAMDVTGPMLALGLTMLLALPLYGDSRKRLARWGGLTALMLAGLLWRITGPGAALNLTVLAGLLLRAERRAPDEGGFRALSRVLLSFLILLALWLVLNYRGWYGPLREAGALLRLRPEDGMGSGRIYIWRQVLAAVPERLWLGGGPDTLDLRGLPPYSYVSPESGRSVTLHIDAAHCEYLHTLVCCGLPAAACHLGLGVCAAMVFFRRRGAARVCAGGAFCYALQAFFGISMCAAAPIFWVLLALSLQEGGEDPEPDGQE